MNQASVWRALEPFVALLTNAGVTRIEGDLVGDDSYFRSPPYGAGWDWGDLGEYYGAEISALTINSNTVQLVVKPGASVGAPAQLAFDPAQRFYHCQQSCHHFGERQRTPVAFTS